MTEDLYIGGYHLEERLGQGGMGVVHLATDANGEKVAVKVLHPHVAADPEARRRLAREMRTLQRVRHPRVAEVIDAELEASTPFLVTQFVPGPSLADDVADNGPFAEEDLVHLGHGLLDALDAVHAADIVHRDLKPANVMLLDGEPVVIDFGIAQVTDEVRVTATGLVMGTPGYLSPEVAEGRPATPATDWWGWAATMAFAATGAHPFGNGPLEAVLDRVRRGAADLDGVPERFEGLLLACLDPNPLARPSGEQILMALVDIESGEVPVIGRAEEPETHVYEVSEPAPVHQPSFVPTEVLGRPVAERAPAPPAFPHYPQPGQQYLGGPQPPRQFQAPVGVPAGYGDPSQGMRPDGLRAPYLDQQGRPLPYQHAPPGGVQPFEPPRRPSRSGTLAALLLAVVALTALGPGVVLLLLLSWTVLARTVGRVARIRQWRSYRMGPGSANAWTTMASLPGSFLLAVLGSAAGAILPLIAATGGALLVWYLGDSVLSQQLRLPITLWTGGLLAALTVWWGPGGTGVRRGTRSLVRAATPGSIGPAVASAVFLVLAALSVFTVFSGGHIEWWPLQTSPFGFDNPLADRTLKW